MIRPYREPRTEAAIRRSVGDYLKTKSQSVRAGWRFGLLVIYSGVNVDDRLATIPSPKPLSPSAAAELGDVLDDMAELIDGLLNPPEVAARRVFIVSAVALDDVNVGLALTNAADDETFDAILSALADRGAPPIVTLQ